MKRYCGQPFYEATTNHDRKGDVTTAVLVVRSSLAKIIRTVHRSQRSQIYDVSPRRGHAGTQANASSTRRITEIQPDTNGATVYTCTQQAHTPRGNTFPHCASDSPSSDVLLYVHWPRRYVMYDKQHVLTCNEKKECVSVHTSCSCFDDPMIYLFVDDHF